ncbi:hypothetical protein V6N11_050230 [Hibiscus sabdariffa]|uniref:Secreted protein n=1 Tax=Hibiscus sabdariffa TaxID=183260 RepID=A0ABR2T971_9ROSI
MSSLMSVLFLTFPQSIKFHLELYAFFHLELTLSQWSKSQKGRILPAGMGEWELRANFSAPTRQLLTVVMCSPETQPDAATWPS